MFKLGAINCGGKVNTVENLCLIPSMCTFVDEPFKARVKAHYGKPLEELAEADRTMAMVADQSLEKFPSYVHCAGRINNGRGECPLLNECKEIRGADITQMLNGSYDPAKEREGINKIPVNGGRFVPVGNPPGKGD
jgi:hypothetical protein